MDNIVASMVNTQFILLTYTIVGIILRRAKIINPKSREQLVRLLMDCTVPFLVLDAFNRLYTSEELARAMDIIIMSLVFSLLSGLAGYFIFKKDDKRRRSVLRYAIMSSNAGMLGLPVVSLVFGEIGVFYASMYMIPLRVVQWSLGVACFTGGKGISYKKMLRDLALTPVMIACYIGLLIMFTNLMLPVPIGQAVKGVGAMSTPLSMMLLGATIADMDKSMFLDKKLALLCSLRLIIIPVICVVSLAKTGIDPVIIAVCAIMLAMPVANNTAGIAERYEGDYVYASAVIGVSTVLSLFTVPLISLVIQKLLF